MTMEVLDAQDLIRAGREIITPFCLWADKPGGAVKLEIVRILRLLPGKRVVALARDGTDSILVKIYLGRGSGRYAGRETRGVRAIDRSGVPTVCLLWQAELPGQGCLLAFAYLRDAISLNDEWDGATSDEARLGLLSEVMRIMSRMHACGVVQQDIHPANFLLSGGEIVTIDGGGISRHADVPLNEDDSLRNLACFFAQFLPRYDHLVSQVLPEYLAARGWEEDPGRLGALNRAIERERELRKRNYLDKIFRDCTRFVSESSMDRFFVCERACYSGQMQALINDPDRFMGEGRTLKDGHSATVVLVNLDGRDLVIKRYNIKGPVHGLGRAFRKSRAWVSWGNAHRMEFLGIPSLKPIALIENRLGPLRTSAYLITEYLEGPDAASLRQMDNPSGETEALIDILHELSGCQISHGDLKATNFVMTSTGPAIIDLDSMQEHRDKASFEVAFRSDLERFMANWQDVPSLRDRFQGLMTELNRQYGVRTTSDTGAG